MKNYIPTIIFIITWTLIVPLSGSYETPLTDTLPAYDPDKEVLTLGPNQYEWVANSMVGYVKKLKDLERLQLIGDSLDRVRMNQLLIASENDIVQDSMISSLETKIERYETITGAYKSLISRRDSVYRLTEKRFITQISKEKRKPKSFFGWIKDKIYYFAGGVLLGLALK